MLKLLILIFIFSLTNATMEQTLINIQNAFGRALYKIVLENCSKTRIFFRKTEEDVAIEAKSLLSTVYITLFSDEELIRFNLDEAVDGIMNSKYFNRSQPVFIFTHGKGDISDNPIHITLVRLVKATRERNALLLDYRKMVFRDPFTTFSFGRHVAKAFGVVLADFYKRGIHNFHLTGHSLGAHVSGIAAKVFNKLTGIKIKRITGLDPAGPCFIGDPVDSKLDKSDAEFVDIIHTNANLMGYGDDLGHVDFYPNGGTDQPSSFILSLEHQKAHDFFLESLSNNNFLAELCTDYESFLNGSCTNNKRIKMGYWLSPYVISGRYYLKTSAKSPYPLGEKGVV